MAVKEVDIGLAADIGTLSRLPKVVGSFSWVKDVCLSARIFGADEALRVGFVSHVEPTKDKAIERALGMAKLLAEKSPVAVQGTKELLNHARDNRLADSLRYTGVWNSAAIQTQDVQDAMLSGLQKRKPTFAKLWGKPNGMTGYKFMKKESSFTAQRKCIPSAFLAQAPPAARDGGSGVFRMQQPPRKSTRNENPEYRNSDRSSRIQTEICSKKHTRQIHLNLTTM